MENETLCLARNIGQTINIGDDITVTVVQVVGCQVKLAISAPKHVAVDRSEIRERKLDDKSLRDSTPRMKSIYRTAG